MTPPTHYRLQAYLKWLYLLPLCDDYCLGGSFDLTGGVMTPPYICVLYRIMFEHLFKFS